MGSVANRGRTNVFINVPHLPLEPSPLGQARAQANSPNYPPSRRAPAFSRPHPASKRICLAALAGSRRSLVPGGLEPGFLVFQMLEM